jgi:hypothetical protein
MSKFLNPSFPPRVLWKNLQVVGAVEDKLNSGPIIFNPNVLNTFYSLDWILLKFIISEPAKKHNWEDNG